MRRPSYLVLSLLLTTFVVSCSADNASGPIPVAGIAIAASGGATSVTAGTTLQLSAVVKDASGATLSGRTVTWSSSNVAAATVDVSGVVRGVAVGTTTITAASEGIISTLALAVTPVPVASVTIGGVPTGLVPKVTAQLAATALDAAGVTLTGRTATWQTSSATVATISETGMLTAVAAGSATITATIEGRNATAAIVVIDPCAAASITTAETVSGIIGAATCVVGTSRRVTYNMVIAQEGDLTVTGTMPAGSGWCFCVYEGDKFLGGVPGGSQFLHLAAGTYKVLVDTHSETAAGAYSISTALGISPSTCTSNCTPVVSRTATIAGTITATDAAYVLFNPATGTGTSDGRRKDTVHRYAYAGETITITLTASAAMQLEGGPPFSVTTPATRSAIGTSVQIQMVVTASDYYDFTVIGTSGSYTLKLQ